MPTTRYGGAAGRDDGADSPYYWRDNVAIVSVGIDIGSSTSHLSFSRLGLRRELHGLSSRFVVVERIPLWSSDITLSPYAGGGERIDAGAVGGFVGDCYERAGLARADVDTGVVILTGQALKRENSRAIADAVSARAGGIRATVSGASQYSVQVSGNTVSASRGAEPPLRKVPVIHPHFAAGTTSAAEVASAVVRELELRRH